jgi:hypothetical protein
MAAIKGLYDSSEKSFEERLDSMGTATPVDLSSSYLNARAVAKAVEGAARGLALDGAIHGAAGDGMNLYPGLLNILSPLVYALGAEHMKQLGRGGPAPASGVSLSPYLRAEAEAPATAGTTGSAPGFVTPGRVGGRGPSPRPRGSSPRPGPSALASGSLGSFGAASSPSGTVTTKTLLDARSARQITANYQATQEQCRLFFKTAASRLSDDGTAHMPLQDAPALFAEGVVAALSGQIALLHVVRATLAVLANDSTAAGLVLKSLETKKLARTVFSAIADAAGDTTHQPCALDRAVGFVCFGTVAVRLLVPLLLLRVLPTSAALQAAAELASIDIAGGTLLIDVEALEGALGDDLPEAFGNGANLALGVLLRKVAESRGSSFSATASNGSTWHWANVVDSILLDHREIAAGRVAGTGKQLGDLVERLARLAMDAARSADRVRQVTGGRGLPPASVLVVAPAAAAAADDDALGDYAVFWVGRSDKGAAPTGTCRHCPGSLPTGARICTLCKKFQFAMFKCPGQCGFPVPVGKTCGIYFCKGGVSKQQMTDAELVPHGEQWVKRHAEAQRGRK